jgi:uncharacterized protein (DUF849 family)
MPAGRRRQDRHCLIVPLLKACLNGPRLPDDHDALPVTAEALAQDTVRVAAAGAGAVHLHVKDVSGADTLNGKEVTAVLTEVRSAAPGVPVGVTTGAWAVADPGQRAELVRTWQVLPDFASVNWHEPSAAELAEALLQLDVGVEAGLWHADAVESWLKWRHHARCLRVLVELRDGMDPAATDDEAARLLARLADADDQVPVLLHGEGTSCWPALRYAAAHGLDTRIGLEDTLELPDGSPAPDNLVLVQTALDVIKRCGHPLM